MLKRFLSEHHIPLTNSIACASDGAPSMVGRHRGFSSLLKREISHQILTVPCVIHRQHLVAKNINGWLNDPLLLVIKTVNKLKSNSLSDRIFRQLCLDNDDDFVRLLYHTEVRWLSKSNCVVRFVKLFHVIISFSESTLLSASLIAAKRDIFCLSDIFTKFNDLIKLLQGKQKILVDCKSFITAFISKLVLYKINISKRQLHQFLQLDSLKD
ncbi:protein FAM200A-like [Octopus sinensis]|uniref:Protein FAM200A-like n=1 Tax=Octopus sinensis TaxID=2607531 RepID=A0A6P7S6W3_9MOLL|nr:protein FAM200A-like [Octopus sinensis]